MAGIFITLQVCVIVYMTMDRSEPATEDGPRHFHVLDHPHPRNPTPNHVLSVPTAKGEVLGDCPFEMNVIIGLQQDLYNIHTDSAGECCAHCNSEPRCRAFTFIDDGTKVCYIKYGDSGRNPASNRISGFEFFIIRFNFVSRSFLLSREFSSNYVSNKNKITLQPLFFRCCC